VKKSIILATAFSASLFLVGCSDDATDVSVREAFEISDRCKASVQKSDFFLEGAAIEGGEQSSKAEFLDATIAAEERIKSVKYTEAERSERRSYLGSMLNEAGASYSTVSVSLVTSSGEAASTRFHCQEMVSECWCEKLEAFEVSNG